MKSETNYKINNFADCVPLCTKLEVRPLVEAVEINGTFGRSTQFGYNQVTFSTRAKDYATAEFLLINLVNSLLFATDRTTKE